MGSKPNPIIIHNYNIYNINDKNIENHRNENLIYKNESMNNKSNGEINNKKPENDIQSEMPYESNLTIIIKNKNYKDIKLYVKSDELIQNIIEKYKSKLQNDKIIDISFQKEDGKYISPQLTIKQSGIKEMEIINAEIYGIEDMEIINAEINEDNNNEKTYIELKKKMEKKIKEL